MKQHTANPLMRSAQIQGRAVVVLGVFGVFSWAAVYPIDEGIPGSGFLISKTERIQVISPTTGLVTKLLRRAGDAVNEGDILLEFDIKALTANVRSVEESIRGTELSNISLRSALDARNAQISALRSEYDSALKLVASGFVGANSLGKIRGTEIADTSLGSALAARNAQVSALRSQYDSSLKLLESGFFSANALATIQNQLSLAQSEALELKSRIEQNVYRLQNQLSLAQSEALELKSRIEQNEYRLRELKERVAAMGHEMALSKIHAPATGKVMNTTVKSAGVNITAGSQIMEIVPDSERLLIDAQIPVDYATRAQVGMSVDVIFPTLPGSSTERIKGKLEYLSADRLTDPRTNHVYLEGRVSLDDQALIDKLRLRAGLPATVLLKTGPRTLLSYITRPLTERMARGLQ